MEWKENPKFPFKILVKYTTRGRVNRFFEGMDSIYGFCVQPDYMRVLISCDLDDKEMNNDSVKERISNYKNAHVVYGVSESKIHAINRDFDLMPDEWKDWDIIVNFSDDQRFTILGWDDMIRVDFNNVFPEKLNGYMAYLDPDTHGALSTLLIAGRGWYNLFDFVYDPKFKSLFCDNIVEHCAKHLGLYHYTGYSIYRHLNPSYYNNEHADQLYVDQQRIGWSVDQALYNEIMSRGIAEYLKEFNL